MPMNPELYYRIQCAKLEFRLETAIQIANILAARLHRQESAIPN